MRPRLLLWLLLLVNPPAWGQTALQPIVFAGQPTRRDAVDIGRYMTVYNDASADTLPVAAVLGKPFRPFLAEPDDRLSRSARLWVAKWLRFTVQNGSEADSLRLWLRVGNHTLIRLYRVASSGGPVLLARAGEVTPLRNRPAGALSRDALPLQLGPNQRQTYLLNVLSIMSYDSIRTKLYTADSYERLLADRQRQQRPALTFYVGLMACFLFVTLFTLVQYVTNQDRIYLWYTLYLMGTLVFFGRLTEYYLGLDMWLPNHPQLRLFLVPPAQLWMQFFYLLFVGTLLDVPRLQPALWRWYRYLLVGIAGFGIVAMGSLNRVFGYADLDSIYFKPAFTGLVALSFITIVLLTGLSLRGKHPLRGYGFAGLLLLTGGAVISIVLNRLQIPYDGIRLSHIPSVYLGVGTLLEVFCFSLALGRRTRLVEIENSQIQKRYAHDLETQLTRRTVEVEEQRDIIEAQRIRQLETAFEQKLSSTEMTALRAQMNPHFIFNCLNSIKLYTMQNDTDRASDYLSRFARLIRLVLENSRSERITLHSELEALRLYIELEAMRFKQKVQYAINVSSDVDQQYLRIPPLLLQPYVENAIWHGLMHKAEGGTVTVSIRQPTDTHLCVTITDDGVGRARATELRSKSAGAHKSFGMQVTADRIRMINHLYNIQTDVTIHDLIAADGQPAGTEVVLQIPV